LPILDRAGLSSLVHGARCGTEVKQGTRLREDRGLDGQGTTAVVGRSAVKGPGVLAAGVSPSALTAAAPVPAPDMLGAPGDASTAPCWAF